MRARWALLAVALCGCPSKSSAPSPESERPSRVLPAAPEPSRAARPRVGVSLPREWPGYVALRADDAAIAYATTDAVAVADGTRPEPLTFKLPDHDRDARQYLVAHDFRPLTPHPPDEFVTIQPKLTIKNAAVNVAFGARELSGKPVTPLPRGPLSLSVVGWAQDERAVVVRLANGGGEGYAIVRVTP